MTNLQERRLHSVEDGLQKAKSAIEFLCKTGYHEYHGKALKIVNEIRPTLKPRNDSEDDHERLCRSLMSLVSLLPVMETLRRSLALRQEDLVDLVRRENLAGELQLVLGNGTQLDDLTFLLRVLPRTIENSV